MRGRCCAGSAIRGWPRAGGCADPDPDHPTDAEAEALAAVGELLGTVYRGELALRVRLGRLDRMAMQRGGRNVSRR